MTVIGGEEWFAPPQRTNSGATMQRRALFHLTGVLSSCSRGGGGLSASAGAAALIAAPAAVAACGAPAYYPAEALLWAFSSAASPASATAKSTQSVPLGHHDSDLTSVACHIGLGRRRDLTMREDLGLWKNGSTRIKLADVFRVGPGGMHLLGGSRRTASRGGRRSEYHSNTLNHNFAFVAQAQQSPK